jgi:Tat protein secretion system quality control protein TatD with DNase activity
VKILREEGFGDDGGRKLGANGGVVHSFTGLIQEAEELVRNKSISSLSSAISIDQRLRWIWASTYRGLSSLWR